MNKPYLSWVTALEKQRSKPSSYGCFNTPPFAHLSVFVRPLCFLTRRSRESCFTLMQNVYSYQVTLFLYTWLRCWLFAWTTWGTNVRNPISFHNKFLVDELVALQMLLSQFFSCLICFPLSIFVLILTGLTGFTSQLIRFSQVFRCFYSGWFRVIFQGTLFLQCQPAVLHFIWKANGTFSVCAHSSNRRKQSSHLPSQADNGVVAVWRRRQTAACVTVHSKTGVSGYWVKMEIICRDVFLRFQLAKAPNFPWLPSFNLTISYSPLPLLVCPHLWACYPVLPLPSSPRYSLFINFSS